MIPYQANEEEELIVIKKIVMVEPNMVYNSTVQYSARYSAVHYCTKQLSEIHNTIYHSIIQYTTVQDSTVPKIQCSIVQYTRVSEYFGGGHYLCGYLVLKFQH